MVHTSSCRARDHPRIRGEHAIERLATAKPSGSSPHTRGAREVANAGRKCAGIIPAYAGSTAVVDFSITARGDHPRIRGEHRAARSFRRRWRGSSPHTRGARSQQPRRADDGGIIPAYAGSTTVYSMWPRYSRDHPRIRGEHVIGEPVTGERLGSSPHTRGALLAEPSWRPDVRIIPAYAGSTRSCPAPPARYRDHPRIRGEHASCCALMDFAVGSSPHTRGARRMLFGLLRPRRIIPAYAGSTLGNPCNTKDRRRDYTSFPLPVTHPSGGGGS